MATNNKILNCPPLRFPQFNDQWKQTTLGEESVIIMGQSPSSSNYNNKGLGLPLIQGNADMRSGRTIIRLYTTEITKEALKDDIIMSVRAPVGALSITPFQCCIGRGVCAIRAGKYIYYYLQDCSKTWSKYSAGSTFDSITGENLRNLPLSLPSLAEQQKIADFLNLIDERIESCSETIKERKREKAALLNQLFGQKLRFPQFSDEWQQTTLGEVLDYEQPTNYIVRNTEYSSNVSLIPVLTANKSFILGYTYEQDAYNKGKCIILDDFTLDIKFVNFPFKVKSSAIKILVAKDGTNILFIYNCLLFLRLSEQEKDHKRHYISEIQPLIVALPSLSEQNKIADFLSLIDERIEVEEELLKQYEMQKKYLLRQMFI